MDIDEIKKLLAAGDVAGAEASAKAALENDPDNVRLLIVFGTCRQLQGDEEAFLGTYELVRAALDEKKVELDATAAEEWKRFEALHERIAQPELLQKGDPPRKSNLMKYVMLAVVVIAAVIVAVTCFGVREIERQYQIMVYSLYGGPSDSEPRFILKQRRQETMSETDNSYDNVSNGTTVHQGNVE